MEKKGAGKAKVSTTIFTRHAVLNRGGINGIGSLKWVWGNNCQRNSLNVAKC